MNIDELLPISNEFQLAYHKYIEYGKQFLASQKICIIGLTRNTSKTILSVIDSLTKLGASAKDHKIIFFENDSLDNTVSVIDTARENNKNLILISKHYNRPQFGPVQDINRTNALAEYRNILKDYVLNKYVNYDFTIVTDTDFKNFSLDGVYNSFGWLMQNNSIGAMCGNSFEYKNIFESKNLSLWNYDSWAYRGSWWNNLQASNTAKINFDPMFWFGLQILPVGSSPFRINSGFGGMTIYRNHFFVGGNYSGEDCEHVMFHYNLKQKYPDFHLFLNPSQRMLLS